MMRFVLFIFSVFILLSCAEESKVVYQIQDVYLTQSGADKPNVKNSKAYISIAYQDIFENTIPTAQLDDLSKMYISFGDVKVVEDLIIRNFLNKSNAKIPSNEQMRADIPAFVNNSYKRFFNRLPNEQELWYFTNSIEKNPEITPETVFLALLTSNEYRNF